MKYQELSLYHAVINWPQWQLRGLSQSWGYLAKGFSTSPQLVWQNGSNITLITLIHLPDDVLPFVTKRRARRVIGSYGYMIESCCRGVYSTSIIISTVISYLLFCTLYEKDFLGVSEKWVLPDPLPDSTFYRRYKALVGRYVKLWMLIFI